LRIFEKVKEKKAREKTNALSKIKTETQSGTHPMVCSHNALIIPHNEQKGEQSKIIKIQRLSITEELC
jgi:hypothetical protein